MRPTYTSPGSRGSAAILALYVKVGACLLAIGADVGRIVTAGGLQDGTLQIDDLLRADRLVLLGALVELLALVVAVALVVRWYATVRANRPVLDAHDAGRPHGARSPLFTTWLVVLGVATVAVLLSWTILGDAEDVADRQRIDTLRAAATALSAIAAGLTIAVVVAVTRRQDERAEEAGVPVASDAPEGERESVSEGGLKVVSEEEARQARPDA